jgi:hypothetical protein
MIPTVVGQCGVSFDEDYGQIPVTAGQTIQGTLANVHRTDALRGLVCVGIETVAVSPCVSEDSRTCREFNSFTDDHADLTTQPVTSPGVGVAMVVVQFYLDEGYQTDGFGNYPVQSIHADDMTVAVE